MCTYVFIHARVHEYTKPCKSMQAQAQTRPAGGVRSSLADACFPMRIPVLVPGPAQPRVSISSKRSFRGTQAATCVHSVRRSRSIASTTYGHHDYGWRLPVNWILARTERREGVLSAFSVPSKAPTEPTFPTNVSLKSVFPSDYLTVFHSNVTKLIR